MHSEDAWEGLLCIWFGFSSENKKIWFFVQFLKCKCHFTLIIFYYLLLGTTGRQVSCCGNRCVGFQKNWSTKYLDKLLLKFYFLQYFCMVEVAYECDVTDLTEFLMLFLLSSLHIQLHAVFQSELWCTSHSVASFNLWVLCILQHTHLLYLLDTWLCRKSGKVRGHFQIFRRLSF